MSANVYEKLLIRMKTSKGSVGRLYWLIDGDKNKWKKKRHAEFDLTSDGKFHNYEIIMRNNRHWSKNVTQLWSLRQ